MATYLRYRYWCNDDARYEIIWFHEDDPVPSGCFTNASHTTDPVKFSISGRLDWSSEDEILADPVEGAVLVDDVKGNVLVEIEGFPMPLGVPSVS